MVFFAKSVEMKGVEPLSGRYFQYTSTNIVSLLSAYLADFLKYKVKMRRNSYISSSLVFDKATKRFAVSISLMTPLLPSESRQRDGSRYLSVNWCWIKNTRKGILYQIE